MVDAGRRDFEILSDCPDQTSYTAVHTPVTQVAMRNLPSSHDVDGKFILGWVAFALTQGSVTSSVFEMTC